MNTTGRERRRVDSLTSRRFYRSDVVDQKLISLIETCEAVNPQNTKIKQSKHLPYWAWYIIAKINGIPLKTGDKPFCGTFLHILTFACAFVYASTYSWYVVYDILSPETKRDIPGGTVSVFLVYYWCGFGFYCKSLISRLFFHQRFLKDVRLHSRTIFKLNASFLALILGLLFTSANLYETFTAYFQEKPCDKISLNPYFCDVLAYSSMIFTAFTLIWHTLISFVFMSVCRTHTIGLRCFSQELEHDAAVFRGHHLSVYKKFTNYDDVWPETTWDSDEEEKAIAKIPERPLSYGSRANGEHHVDNSTSSAEVHQQTFEQSDEIGILLSRVTNNLQDSDTISSLEETRETYVPACELRNMAASVTDVVESTMSSTEILHNFWKINRRLRFSSAALQRWFASFMALVLLRCSTYLVYWLGHTAGIFDVIQFILPLILLVVLSSALAEVNFEGQRFLRSVYPTGERLKMLQYLSMNPLQMPIYGFGMTHGTIVTVIFAILVGFVTRIVITELTK